MSSILLALFAAVCAGIGTGLARRYALARGVLDVPNERSSHTQPVPRGGGLALVAAVLIALAVGRYADLVATPLFMALLGGIPVAVIGWVDDRRGTPASVRLLTQLVAALWAVYWLSGTGDGVLATILSVVGIIWLTNLYNFMDGIDGIASGEALVVAAAGALLAGVIGTGLGIPAAAAIVAGASLGFLFWNWAPARIFMGDVGSGFLGFSFGVIALASERSGSLSLTGWLLLLGVFLFDATLTLARRMLHGERWYAAHRRHAYQRLTQSGYSHARVSAGTMAASALLGVAAAAAALHPAARWIAVASSIVFLSALYLWAERRRPMWSA